MDHLPNFTDTPVPYRIPCLSLAPIDRQTLQEYSLDRIIEILGDNQADALCDAVVQELLWHDTIEQFSAIWDVPHVRSTHIETDADGHRLSTAWLRDTFADHVYQTRILPDVVAKHGSGNAFDEHVLQGLSEAGIRHIWTPDSDLVVALQTFFSSKHELTKRICTVFWQTTSRYGHQPRQRNRYRLIAGALILIEYLASLTNAFVFKPLSARQDCMGYREDALVSLRQRGRCMHRTRHCQTMTLLFWATFMVPALDSTYHSACTFQACVASPSASPAEQTHWDCDGSCTRLTMDMTRLNDIVQSGGIAVLETLDTTITPIPANGKNFIAISHVWSHGLGNPDSNSMNACLLRKLFHLAKQCDTPCPTIWIDTLCVPTRKHFPNQWRTALDRMKEVYSTANKVLVIDKDLLGCGRDLSLRQFELLHCDWMHRLWTLQEMLLPSVEDILIVFGDDIVSATAVLAEARCGRLSKVGFEDILHVDLCQKFQIEKDSTIREPMLNQPIETILDIAIQDSQLMSIDAEDDGIRDLLQEAAEHRVNDARRELTIVANVSGPDHVRVNPGIDRLSHIRQALAERAVTNPLDEPICLATLLDINVANLPRQISMESVYVSLGIVPLWLLYDVGPRLDSTGFRWALRSFMFMHAALIYQNSSYGAVTEDGLLLTQDVFVGSTASLPKTGEDVTLNIRGCDLANDLMFTSPGFVAPIASTATNFALLIGSRKILSGEEPTTMACLLLIHEETRELVSTHFLCTGQLTKGMPTYTVWNSIRPQDTYVSCYVTSRPESTILVD